MATRVVFSAVFAIEDGCARRIPHHCTFLFFFCSFPIKGPAAVFPRLVTSAFMERQWRFVSDSAEESPDGVYPGHAEILFFWRTETFAEILARPQGGLRSPLRVAGGYPAGVEEPGRKDFLSFLRSTSTFERNIPAAELTGGVVRCTGVHARRQRRQQ